MLVNTDKLDSIKFTLYNDRWVSEAILCDTPHNISMKVIWCLNFDNNRAIKLNKTKIWLQKYLTKLSTYTGAGSPSASHSITKGLSFSSALAFTLNNTSSVGGCLIMYGGLCTEMELQVLNVLCKKRLEHVKGAQSHSKYKLIWIYKFPIFSINFKYLHHQVKCFKFIKNEKVFVGLWPSECILS